MSRACRTNMRLKGRRFSSSDLCLWAYNDDKKYATFYYFSLQENYVHLSLLGLYEKSPVQINFGRLVI